MPEPGAITQKKPPDTQKVQGLEDALDELSM